MSRIAKDLFAGEGADFNTAAAGQVYSQIMKMDADSATVFARMVVGAAVQRDLIVHDREIAEEVSKQVEQRISLAKAHLARQSIAKARNGQDNTAELEALVEISKFGLSFIGDFFNPRARSERAKQEARDPEGRFKQVLHERIDVGDGVKTIPGFYAGKLGIPDAAKHGHQLTPEQNAKYQHGYYQVQRLLRPYLELPKGDGRVTVRYTDNHTDHFALPHKNEQIPVKRVEKITVKNEAGEDVEQERHVAGIDPTRQVASVELNVVPGLDHKGAIFSALNALGLPGLGARASGAADNGALNPDKLAAFGETWHRQDPTDQYVPSQRMYRRLGAGADLIEQSLGATAPPQARMALAAAKHIGRLGPVAQRVVGPSLDRAAYRYRGTERTPDPALLNALQDDQRTATRDDKVTVHDRALKESERTYQGKLAQAATIVKETERLARQDFDRTALAHRNGTADRKALQSAEKHYHAQVSRAKDRARDLQARARKDWEAAQKRHGKMVGEAKAARTAKAVSIVRRGQEQNGRWMPGKVLGYMRSRVPSPELNELQLKSGVVPPSEGIILDDQGHIKAQTVGYGDDHYLPFTLRNLAGLRGGYYLRTRVFGGPTTEDIYTALMSGAKGLTVVSNSGVFTVDFDNDLKGGRRFNDKSAKMVARYGHLLDAVKGGHIPGADIHPSRMREIAEGARAAAGDNEEAYGKELERRVRGEHKNPRLSKEQQVQLASEFLSERAGKDGAVSLDELAEEIAQQHVKEHERGLKRGNPQFRGFDSAERAGLLAQKRQELTSSDLLEQAHKLATATGGAGGPRALDAHLARAQGQLREELADLKLNGRGYDKALKALRQQFPYYLQEPEYHQFNDGVDGNDTGYVKPKFNRPEAAKAGYFDPTIGGGGKASADTIRWQNGIDTPRDRGAEQQQQQVAMPGNPLAQHGVTRQNVTPDQAKQLRAKADEAMLEELLSKEHFDPSFFNPQAGQPAPTNVSLWSARNQGHDNYPEGLKAFFKNSPDELRTRLAENPQEMHELLRRTVETVQSSGAVKLNREVVESFKAGGMRQPAMPYSLTAALDKNNKTRDFDLSHRGYVYAHGGPQTTTAVEDEYRDNPRIKALVEKGALPATPGDLDDAKAEALRAKLEQGHLQYRNWVARGRGWDRPALDEAQLDTQAQGLVEARQLARRYREVRGDADAAQAAEARRAEAERPVVNVHRSVGVTFMPHDAETLANMTPEERAVLLQQQADAAKQALFNGGNGTGQAPAASIENHETVDPSGLSPEMRAQLRHSGLGGV